MSHFLRPEDQNSIELSSTDGDERPQTTQRSEAFGDFEKPFPSVTDAVPIVGAEVNASGRIDPTLADPTVYDIQTFRIPEGTIRDLVSKDCELGAYANRTRS